MKITSVFAAMPMNHGGLLEVKNSINSILSELGAQVEEINLAFSGLPYYDGLKSEYMNEISGAIRQSDGVIFYYSTVNGLPGSLLINLFEHLSFPEYAGMMNGKNCFSIAYSDDGAGTAALTALDSSLYAMGAFSSFKMLLDKAFCADYKEGTSFFAMAERNSEDFFRSLRQQKKFYIPKVFTEFQNQAEVFSPVISSANPHINKDLKEVKIIKEEQPVKRKLNHSEDEIENAIKRLNLDAFDEAQKNDIDEISKLFAGKLGDKQEINSAFNQGISKQEEFTPILPNIRPKSEKPTLSQRTAALSHYFRPSFADGMIVNIAVQITGNESFEGYFKINEADCDFVLESVQNPDVLIISADKKWEDIIKGKITAQKAFMIGQIKVRGNFVLLSKFDQIFDFSAVKA